MDAYAFGPQAAALARQLEASTANTAAEAPH
jgi:hypothetical protein